LSYDGVAIARFANLFASAYNKPVALDLFVKDHLHRTNVFFVDDNSDNAWNMYYHFAQHEIKGTPSNHVMSSFWFPPPDGGKDEKFHPPFRALLTSVAGLHQTN